VQNSIIENDRFSTEKKSCHQQGGDPVQSGSQKDANFGNRNKPPCIMVMRPPSVQSGRGIFMAPTLNEYHVIRRRDR